jgi:hypothetical protein
LPGCQRPLLGRQSKYCSPKHKSADYDRLHPRLNFEASGYLAPRPLPDSPEARRNTGKAIAAANHREDLERARELALEMLASGDEGTIADLRDYAAYKGVELPWHLPWTANVFLPPRDGAAWFEPTGERRATRHKRGNARKVNVYRLSQAGAAELDRRGR